VQCTKFFSLSKQILLVMAFAAITTAAATDLIRPWCKKKNLRNQMVAFIFATDRLLKKIISMRRDRQMA
jgi:hypothetical protein